MLEIRQCAICIFSIKRNILHLKTVSFFGRVNENETVVRVFRANISLPSEHNSLVSTKHVQSIMRGGNIYSVYLEKRIYIAERAHWYANEYGLCVVGSALSMPSIKYKMATMNRKLRTPFDVSRMGAFLAGNSFFSPRIPTNDTPEVRFFYFSFDDGINQPFISRPICLMGLWVSEFGDRRDRNCCCAGGILMESFRKFQSV